MHSYLSKLFIQTIKKSLLAFGLCIVFVFFPFFLYAYELPHNNVTKHTVLGIWDETEDLQKIEKRILPIVPKGGLLRMSALGSFDSFNPFAARGIRGAYIHLTYETLGQSVSGEDFLMQGLLAKEFILSNDRSFMLVVLNENARFADGKPVTAYDVVYTFNALMKEASPHYRAYYAQVKNVEAKGTHEVLFTFAESHNRELPLIICQLPVLPAHWLKGKNLGEPLTEVIPASGPYKVKEYTMGSRLVLERRKDWWGEKLPINQGYYNFDTISVDYYRDVTVAREAFFAGSVDFFMENTIKDWKNAYDVPAVRNGNIVKKEQKIRRNNGMGGLFMNTRHEVLADKKVRQALNYVFDFEWANRALFYNAYERFTGVFTGSPLSAPLLPSEEEKKVLAEYAHELDSSIWEALPTNFKTDGSGRNAEGLRKALALLEEAGWTLKNGVMQNKQGKQLQLTMILSSQQLQRVYVPFQKNLQRLGIKLDIQLIDQTQYIGRIRAYDFDLVYAMVPQSQSPGNEQRQFWGSKAANTQGTRNLAGIQDKVIDDIIEKLIAAPTEKEWKTYVAVLDRLIQHGSYFIYGWYSPNMRFAWWQNKICPPSKGLQYGIDLMAWYASDGNKSKTGVK